MTSISGEILQRASKIVAGDRAEDYGSIWRNHQNIAQLWNGYLYNAEGLLTAEDVANMMELLKIARRKVGACKEDNYIDGAGYAAVAYECAREEVERSHPVGPFAEGLTKITPTRGRNEEES
jgi:hypothetical protein|tara:strand:+ start:2653 stop:3018 length:366 start_codon:yes stop_codon:yes gene_type:complete